MDDCELSIQLLDRAIHELETDGIYKYLIIVSKDLYRRLIAMSTSYEERYNIIVRRGFLAQDTIVNSDMLFNGVEVEPYITYESDMKLIWSIYSDDGSNTGRLKRLMSHTFDPQTNIHHTDGIIDTANFPDHIEEHISLTDIENYLSDL